MRSPVVESGNFKVRAIASTHAVLLCFDVAKSAPKGLLGFAIKHKVDGAIVEDE